MLFSPLLMLFSTDHDHSGQHESTAEQAETEQKHETGSKFCDFNVFEVLKKRVGAVITFLIERGLALRGQEEMQDSCS